MSRPYLLRCKSLHELPKFASSTQRIQVGNGQYVGVLFVIPVSLTIQVHRLEVFTLVSEIYENVDLILVLCKAVLSFCAILHLISLNVCLGVLHVISLYGALSLHNPAHLQVLFPSHCRIIGGIVHLNL